MRRTRTDVFPLLEEKRKSVAFGMEIRKAGAHGLGIAERGD
jgi:hypothetical protein